MIYLSGRLAVGATHFYSWESHPRKEVVPMRTKFQTALNVLDTVATVISIAVKAARSIASALDASSKASL